MNLNKVFLDLRKIPPFGRHEKIWSIWDSLPVGGVIQITNDHSPKPLYYQFEAEQKGKFEWKYRQEGPVEWIFEIRKTDGSTDKEKIKELLRELKEGSDTKKVKEKGKELLRNISAKDLGMLEQEIVNEGLSRKDMRKLCDVHLEVMAESLSAKKIKLEKGHPIKTMMEEHKKIIGFIGQLTKNISKLKKKKDFAFAKKEIEELIHLSKQLVEADKHHKREEKVLFPALELHGINEPPMIMLEEHHELVPRKKKLYALAKNHKGKNYTGFVKEVTSLVEFISKELPSHIYKEDNILYPMAIESIPKKEWILMKKRCDEIGYCCFTPQIVPKKKK